MRLLTDWYQANKLLKYCSEGESFELEINGINIKNAHQTKFLGVLVDDCPSQKGHVNQLINKINVNKNLLSNTKNRLPTPVLKNIYRAHKHSHMTYGLVVWGSMISATDKETIYIVQKQCICTVCKKSQRTHMDPLFATLKMIKFLGMIKLELCKLGNKITKKLLPKPILDIFHQNSGIKKHRYPTHNKSTPNIQKHTSTNFNSGFMCGSL